MTPEEALSEIKEGEGLPSPPSFDPRPGVGASGGEGGYLERPQSLTLEGQTGSGV